MDTELFVLLLGKRENFLIISLISLLLQLLQINPKRFAGSYVYHLFIYLYVYLSIYYHQFTVFLNKD